MSEEETVETLRAELAEARAACVAKDEEIRFLRRRLRRLRVLAEELCPQPRTPRRAVPLPPEPTASLDSSFPGIKLRRGSVLANNTGKLALAQPAVSAAAPAEKKKGSKLFHKRK